jgi:hypothetical protein
VLILFLERISLESAWFLLGLPVFRLSEEVDIACCTGVAVVVTCGHVAVVGAGETRVEKVVVKISAG